MFILEDCIETCTPRKCKVPAAFGERGGVGAPDVSAQVRAAQNAAASAHLSDTAGSSPFGGSFGSDDKGLGFRVEGPDRFFE